ncbi:MAG TPA: glycoside hydrolase family 3 C-terminal domain-containing protein [Ignavibacteriaceae bacterium]|nr:glycoside hydrolase family 3 C-terminal domain-containing protein [Ignavibacteriaceae bacterium]
MVKKQFIIPILLFLNVTVFPQQLPYQNTSHPISKRVDGLISRMTFEEKVSQMVYNAPAIERLGIPAYNWWNEALHGVARNGLATVFPQAIGLAATWNVKLMYDVADAISDEARAKFNRDTQRGDRGLFQGLTFWSPNINIFRDPRWGRGMETYGEDPHLTGEMGKAFVTGMQGNNPKYFKTIATPKHFAVHSGPESLRHKFNTDISNYDLRETYLPAFKKSIIEGGAFSVMCAYNRFRDFPCCGNNLLLQKILRDEWGFKGYVVTDCGAIDDMWREWGHLFVKTSEEAAALSANAGSDLNCGDQFLNLDKSIALGLVDTNKINQSVKRLFTARFKLGMFDPPGDVPFNKIKYGVVNSTKNRDLALKAARESIVLLKNKNHLLPLSKNIKKIAVIGPNANDVEVLLGNYNGIPKDPVTPLQGIINKIGKTAKVVYEQGCNLAENLPSFSVIPSEYLFTGKGKNKRNGLKGEYFSNNKFEGNPSHTKIDKLIDFQWWDGAPFPEFNHSNFGVRWTGYLVPQKTGDYYIGGYGFNAARIYFEDSLIVNFNGNYDLVKGYKKLHLNAGEYYQIKAEFYERNRYASFQLIWSPVDDNMEEKPIEAVRNSDVAVMFMGLSPRLEGEQMNVEVPGFLGGDRVRIDLPDTQQKLIKDIQATGKPIVLVLLNGSAVAINWSDKNIPAIIETWYGGEDAGTAIADVLFGDYNPGGKLPVTFYKSVEKLPEFTDYNMKGRTYRYFNGDVLYPFGFGLSYTTYEFKNIKLDKNIITKDEFTNLKVEVKNSGNTEGDEVIQLYVKNPNDNKEIKALKGFKRISLKPGETRQVTFKMDKETLQTYNDENGFVVDPGEYLIYVGSSSAEKDLKKLTLKIVN